MKLQSCCVTPSMLMPFGKVIVAIANKHARQIWAMLALNADYDPAASRKHPLQQRRAAA